MRTKSGEIKSGDSAPPALCSSSSNRRKSDLSTKHCYVFQTRRPCPYMKKVRLQDVELSMKQVTANYLYRNEKCKKDVAAAINVAVTEALKKPEQSHEAAAALEVIQLHNEEGHHNRSGNTVVNLSTDCSSNPSICSQLNAPSTEYRHRHSYDLNSGSRKPKQTLIINDEVMFNECGYNTDLDNTLSKPLNDASFFCLLCSKNTTQTISNITTSSYKDKIGADFLAMFILKKMFNVPSENLAQFLSVFGHPREWIYICHECTLIVTGAFQLQKKISELELKLRRFQREMKETITKTFEGNQFNNQSVDGLSISTTTLSSLDSIIVTKNTRHYVSNGVWPISSSAIFTNDYVSISSPFQQEEPEIIETNNLYETATDSYLHDSDDSQSDSGAGGGGDENTIEGDPLDICNEPSNNNDKKQPPSENDGIKAKLKKIASVSGCRKYKQTSFTPEPVYSCAVCPLLKPMELHSFVKHLVFHYEKPYKCKECNAYFTGSELELKKRPEEKQCSNGHVCTKSTLVKVKLDTVKIWECGYCSSMFKLNSERESHEKVAHPEEKPIPLPWDCSKCPNKFRDYHEWRMHRALSHMEDLGKYGCFYCDEIFKLETIEDAEVEDLPGRSMHMKKEHGLLANHGLHLFDCRICGVNFQFFSRLKDHIMEKEHGTVSNVVLTCPICFGAFPDRYADQSHLQKVHQSRKGNYSCDVCGVVNAMSKAQLLEHKLLEHGIQPPGKRKFYKCSQESCTFKCLRITTRDKHLTEKHGMLKCKVCGEKFMESKLSDHMKSHQYSENKPYRCETCGDSFTGRNYLYIHMRLLHQNRPSASTNKNMSIGTKRTPTQL